MKSIIIKKQLALILFFVLASFIYAQNPQNFNWANRAATLLNPSSYSGQSCAIASQAVDNNGFIYILGDFSSSVEFYLSGQMTSGADASFVSRSDIFVTKLNQNGTVVWKKKFGNAAISEGSKQIVVHENNLYILGQFKNVNVGGSSAPTNDGILKLDLNGNYVSFISTVDISGSGLTVEGFKIFNNVIYLYGTFSGTKDFNISSGVANLSASALSGFVQKITMIGSHINVKKIGGTASLFLNEMEIINNDIYLVGRFSGTANLNPLGSTFVTVNSNAGFILNIDTAYNYQWSKILDNISYSSPICSIKNLAVDKDGEKIYIIGSIGGEFNFDMGKTNLILGTPPSTTQNFIAKYNTANGNMVWAKLFKSSTLINPNVIKVDNNNDVYVSGGFQGFVDFNLNAGTSNLLSNGATDAFINKIDSSSLHIWSKQMGGLGSDNGFLISLDTLNNLIVSGSFNQAGDFNPESSAIYNLGGAGSSGFAGTFTIKMGDSLSCSTSTNTLNVTICSGSSYLFNGINRTSAGTYSATLSNVGGCDSIVMLNLSVTSTVSPNINISTSNTVICSGNTSVFTSTISNGGAGPIYQWKKNGVNIGSSVSSFSSSILVNGDIISCTLISNETCASTSTVNSNNITITVNPTPTISVNNGTICSGKSFTIIPTRGSSYTISGGSSIVNPLISSSYTVIGSNSTGCTSSTVSSVNINPTPTVSVNSGSICSSTSFTLSPMGASSYTYSSGSAIVNPLTSASYTIIGSSAAGCTNSAVSNVTVNPTVTPAISISTPTNSICGSSAAFTSTISNGGSSPAYQWKKNGVNVGSGTPSYAPTSLINGDVIYCILNSNAVCASPSSTTSNSITITVNPTPTITLNSGAICSGNSFTIVPIGASSYTYSGGSAIVNPLTSSSYTVIGISAVGCTNSAVSNVTVNPTPTISINSGFICSGASFTFSPSGASSYTYSSGGFIINPLTSSSYTVIGSSAVGCTNSAISNVTVNPTPTISINSGSICSGNSYTLSPTGASSYTYSSGSTIVNPLTSASYTVIGSSIAGCTNSAVSNVTVNPTVTPAISISTPSSSICGSSAAFSSTISNGGTTPAYQWKKNGVNVGSGIPSYSSTSLINGDVIYCILNSNAVCASPSSVNSNSITITVNPTPSVSVNSGSICSSTSFTLSPMGASSYTYSSGSAIVNPLTSASYTVIGSSAAGCTNSAVSNVTVNPTVTPVISISTPITSICGSSAAFTSTISNGGSSPAYQWKKNGVNVGSGIPSYSPTSLINGDVIYCILNSNAVCASPSSTTSNSITITVNPTPTISVSSGGICAGKSFTVNPTGASSYTISGGSFVVSPSLTSSYSITGTSAFGCVGSNTAICSVSVNPNPTITITSSNSLICVGQTASLTASGALTYTWSSSAVASGISVSPSSSASYSVVGIDAIGCSNSASFTQSVSVCTNLQNASLTNSTFNVFPNPNNGNFNIELNSSTTISIYNLLGEVIYSENLIEGKYSIDIQNQPNGVYIVKSNNNNHSFKLIKN